MDSKLRVKNLIEHFNLELINDDAELNRIITVSDLHRPGIELAGYFTYYPSERIQILGKTELSFLGELDLTIKRKRINKLCQQETPCIIATRDIEVSTDLLEIVEEHKVPLLRTPISTTHFISILTNYLEDYLAPIETIHGVLVDVYGVGILLMGKSGIGKSETALELVKKGHRLVADDVVELKRSAENELIGKAPEMIRYLLEIRGVGIIDVLSLFGAGAIKNLKKVTLVIELEMWDSEKDYDRLGLDENTTKLLGVNVPINVVPVRPGRNLAEIVEVVAMNYRLKSMGHNSAKEFTDRLARAMSEEQN